MAKEATQEAIAAKILNPGEALLQLLKQKLVGRPARIKGFRAPFRIVVDVEYLPEEFISNESFETSPRLRLTFDCDQRSRSVTIGIDQEIELQ